MNLEELPLEIKNEIEDQSLEILESIKEKIIVIGEEGAIYFIDFTYTPTEAATLYKIQGT